MHTTNPRDPQPWMADALCAQTGPDDLTWYPAKGGSAVDGRRLCSRCPVRSECLEYAMATEAQSSRHGIWGGTSALERERIWHERNAA